MTWSLAVVPREYGLGESSHVEQWLPELELGAETETLQARRPNTEQNPPARSHALKIPLLPQLLEQCREVGR